MGAFSTTSLRSHSAIGFALAASFVVGCPSSPTVRSFSGNAYDETNDCLEPSGVLDVLEVDETSNGEATGACVDVCLVGPKAEDGSTRIYVSRECAPYPVGFDSSGADARCAKALEAKSCSAKDAGK